MTLSIDDILERVAWTEGERAGYNDRAAVERMMMATFTKLFAIKMVAKSLRGLASRSITRWPEVPPRSCTSRNCVGEREKRATSLADIAAEQTKSTPIASNTAAVPGSSAFICSAMFRKSKDGGST